MTTILEGPHEWGELSEEMRNRFTLDGRIPLRDWFIRENSPNKLGMLWPEQIVLHGVVLACRREGLEGIRSYDEKSIFDFYKALERYPVAQKDVLVIGSQRPWVEICCLAFGARSVTTVDYNPPISEYAGIRTVGVEQFEKEERKYQVLISYSSLEHDGLGRYGDPIDPDGDLKRMRSYLDVVEPGGLFFLGVPGGRDALYWNAHRVYGEIRLPMLCAGWRLLDFFLEDRPQEELLNQEEYEHAWWVLTPEK